VNPLYILVILLILIPIGFQSLINTLIIASGYQNFPGHQNAGDLEKFLFAIKSSVYPWIAFIVLILIGTIIYSLIRKIILKRGKL